MTTSHPARPFTVLGLQQVAIGHANKTALIELWVNILGLNKINSFQSASENVNEDILSLGAGKNSVEIDLMQPLDPEKKPRVDTPALNHIGFWVDDLKAAYTWLQDQGVRMTPGGIRQGASGYEVCFIHPKSNTQFPLSGLGVLIELVQAPSDIISALSAKNIVR